MKNNNKNKIDGNLNVKAIETKENKIILCLEDFKLSENKEYKIVLKKHKENNDWTKVATDVDFEKSELTFDMELLYNDIVHADKYLWNVYLEVTENNNKKMFALIKNSIKTEFLFKDKRYLNRLNRMIEPFAKIEREDEQCVVFPVFDEYADLTIISVRETSYLAQIIMGKILKADINKDVLEIKIKYPKSEYVFKRLLLVYRTKKSEDKKEYEFNVDKIVDKKNYYIISASMALKTIVFKSIIWDLNFVVGNSEQEHVIDIKNQSRLFKLKYCSLFYNNSYKIDKGMFVYPYVTLVKSISLAYREIGAYDGVEFKLKERLALARYLLTYFYLKRQNIYLVYEKFCYMAQDNGYYFFKYCMDNNMEKKMGRKIYYIMDKNSPDREVLKPYEDHVIDFMSIKHITYLLAAKVLISTDTKIHAYAWRKRGSILDHLVRRQRLVFLQHGVTAFKKVHFLYGKNKTGGCNLFVVTSDFEKDIVEKNFGYKDNEIAVTGFARWDVLNDKSEGSREIILMPTWRNWLEELDDKQFEKSNYYINYMKLLKSPRLQEMLEKYDLTMNFYLHPKFKEYIKNFVVDEKRIRFIPFGEEPLNELMMKCRMLITDYSSVAWDTYYQNKPVLFYQFDLDEYNETHGSYINMKEDLFGERVEEIEPLIDLIGEYADNDFKLKPEYEIMKEKCFKYVDNDNSKRICEHIIKKGW